MERHTVVVNGSPVVVNMFGGRNYVNVTPHDINVQLPDGTDAIMAKAGVQVNARSSETVSGERDGVRFVRQSFSGSEADEAMLAALEVAVPNAFIIGSILSAQAYPGRILGLVSVPGFERMPPNEKKMLVDKFSIY